MKIIKEELQLNNTYLDCVNDKINTTSLNGKMILMVLKIINHL